MGCCGSLTSSSTGLPPISNIPSEGDGQRYMQPGENVECWAERTQSTPDKEGAAPPPGKIVTAAVAAGCDLSFNQQIDAVPPKDGSTTSWDAPEWSPVPTSPGPAWSASGNNGKFTGSFAKDDEGKEFSLKITSQFSDGTSDTKSYSLKPVLCKPDEDSITLTNPFPGAIQTAPFGEVRPASGGGTRAHKGQDYGNSSKGGPIVAAADGVVLTANGSSFAAPGLTGYGYCVIIQHSDKSGKPMCNTLYAHLSSVQCTVGQKVAKGQTIGQAGGSGAAGLNSYPLHLHFELHVAGKCKDPAPYIEPAVKHKVGSDSKPLWSGAEPAAPSGSSKNYGAEPAPGKTTSGPDGYQTANDPNANSGKAVNKGTVEMTSKQCAGATEPPLEPATPAQEAEKPCVTMVTMEQLQKAMPSCGNRCNQFLGHINRVIGEDIVDDISDKCGEEAKKRISMFLAQVAHESGNLRYVRELASGQAYEGRRDLGNTQPGDGVKFKGRGLIQLTGRANYEKFGKFIGQDLTSNPDVVAADDYLAVKAAGWFWKTNKLNGKSDSISAATKKINGGTNGLADRERKWAAAKSALNA